MCNDVELGPAGTCLLVARSVSDDAESRLRAMLETNDGFVIADVDLRIRGPGEFLGTRQSGHLPGLLPIADLVFGFVHTAPVVRQRGVLSGEVGRLE